MRKQTVFNGQQSGVQPMQQTAFPQQPMPQEPMPQQPVKQNLPSQQMQSPQASMSQQDVRDAVKQAYNQGIQDARQNTRKSQKPKQPVYKIREHNDGVKNALNDGRYISPTKLNRHEQAEVHSEGKEAAIEESEREKEQVRQRFSTIAKRHDITLVDAKTIFPFTILADKLIVDTTKVTIIHTKLFATHFITTIPLKDVADVSMQTLWFLGSLDLKYMPQASSPSTNEMIDIRIANLPRKEALKAKNILKGAMVAKAEEIDIAKLTPEEVINVLDEFGKTHEKVDPK